MWSVFVHESDYITQLGPFKTEDEARVSWKQFEKNLQRVCYHTLLIDPKHKAVDID